MKILLVDDNKVLRESFRDFLQGEFSGAEFMEAATGREALTKLNELGEAEWPDVVLTDYEMPDMNGLELLAAIRVGSSSVLSKVPVIVISGILDYRALETNVKRLDGSFLKKPIPIKDLVAAVKKVLGLE